MDGIAILQAVLGVGGFLVALAGFAFGVWKYVEGKVDRARSDASIATKAVEIKADAAMSEVAAVRLHVAEHYVTKAGMSEQTDRIMKSIEGVAEKIDRTNERLDAIMLTNPPRSRTRT